jgi:hypothetical protein
LIEVAEESRRENMIKSRRQEDRIYFWNSQALNLSMFKERITEPTLAKLRMRPRLISVRVISSSSDPSLA